MSILIGILACIALILIIALLIGTNMDVEKSIIIQQPQEKVFEYVRFIKNHDHFSVWAMMDPDMKKEFSGTDGEIGFTYAWDSAKEKNVGAGVQEIKAIIPYSAIQHELRFSRPMQDVAQAHFTFSEAGNGTTRVQWSLISRMKFPLNIFKPMIRGMLGKQLETGLVNLKTVLEK